MTKTASACDDCNVAVNLPFAYTMYDQTFSAGALIQLSSNGNIQFVSNDIGYNNSDLPAAYGLNGGAFNRTIFANWDDLRTDASGFGIWYSTTGSAPNRVFNVVWISATCFVYRHHTIRHNRIFFNIGGGFDTGLFERRFDERRNIV
jgi:hypothetical protein